MKFFAWIFDDDKEHWVQVAVSRYKVRAEEFAAARCDERHLPRNYGIVTVAGREPSRVPSPPREEPSC